MKNIASGGVIMNKTFIVTGGSGFLGNNVIRKLIAQGETDVRALVMPGDKAQSLQDLDCRIYYGDVTKKETLDEIFDVGQNSEVYVIHCAAVVYIKSGKNPLVREVNVGGTMNVVDKVLEKNAKLVYVNSVHSIPEKPNGGVMEEIYDFSPDRVKGIYAKSKAECAALVLSAVEKHGLNACIVQPSGIIGPGDYGHSHLTQLIIDFCNHKLTACVKGGYDFVDVRDVADGIISACYNGKKGNCYILSNKFITVKQLLDTISEVSGCKKIKTVLPMWFARLTAPLSEIYYNIRKQPPLYTSYSLYTLTANANFSHRKADCELGYKTTDFTKTVSDAVEWLKAHGEIKPVALRRKKKLTSDTYNKN